MKISKKNLLFYSIALFFLILFLELLLSILSFVSPKIDNLISTKEIAFKVPDKQLGHRPNPAIFDHDAKGFRNSTIPESAKIVALGDSQTYGTGIKANQAWPKQLEQLIQDTVYSMAYGGYGPTHSLLLFEEALELKPSLMIEAFYTGNDLYDAFNLVYNLGQLSNLKTTSKSKEQLIRKKEEAQAISKEVEKMFSYGASSPDNKTSTLSSIKNLLSSHSKLYRLLRVAKNRLSKILNKEKSEWTKAVDFAEKHKAYCEIFEEDSLRTIFTPVYRFTALNLEDERIAEGLRINLECIRQMNTIAMGENIDFLALLIPTKELVFYPLVKNPSEELSDLIIHELKVRDTFKEFMETYDIQYLDALPGLTKLLKDKTQPYKVNNDGHMNQYGQEAVAQLVFKHLH